MYCALKSDKELLLYIKLELLYLSYLKGSLTEIDYEVLPNV